MTVIMFEMMTIVMYNVKRCFEAWEVAEMRVSREQAAKNRQEILRAASRRFREVGFSGAGVADLMKEVGLTHGGFYCHFNSKDELAAEACAAAMDEKARKWTEFFEPGAENSVRKMAAEYLTRERRDNPGAGCPLAALAVDVSRQSTTIRDSFTKGFCSLVKILMSAMPGRTVARKRRDSLATWSTLVGALVLARAVNDEELSNEILNAAANALEER